MKNETDFRADHFQTVVWFAFLALVVSVSIVTPIAYFQHARLSLPDFLFPFVALLFTIAVLRRKIVFRWHKFYWLLLFYFAAMLISSVFSINPGQSFIKLTGEVYLLGLAVLTFNLVRTERDFNQAIRAWLLGTAITISVGIVTIFLFYSHSESPVLAYTTSIYGAVPVGNYPRLTSLFYSASMFCNFLNVSLIMLFIAEKLNFIGKKLFWISLFLILVCALFTISSGLGGIILAIGVWFWLTLRDSRNNLAATGLTGGISIAIVFFIVNFFALQKYPNAPFSIVIPFSGVELLPSPRVLVWSDSLNTFQNNFLNGSGLGQNSCAVSFQNTDGTDAFLTDAHNIFLSVASQNGILGLLAIAAIMFFLIRKFSYSTFNKNRTSFLKNAFVLAFVCAFFYQGLTGSFEDTRHLWVLIGLILSAETLEITET